MRRLVSVGLLLLLAGIESIALAGGVDRDTAAIKNRLVGAWRLARLEESDADGKIYKADCTGLLVYTPDGHMSVQVMYQNTANAAPTPYAQGGYEASFGSYEIEDANHFTFHVEGALVRTLIGNDLKRFYELSGRQLVVKSADPSEHWRVVWERY
jgi:hypothetical protein